MWYEICYDILPCNAFDLKRRWFDEEYVNEDSTSTTPARHCIEKEKCPCISIKKYYQ